METEYGDINNSLLARKILGVAAQPFLTKENDQERSAKRSRMNTSEIKLLE